ncbi:MAG: hypothetical protein ACD_47C00114G0003 [uncultured bacterium]|nr:MAG: hypothetical protein ACD_47C00114G0003 [uncultured bacterium]
MIPVNEPLLDGNEKKYLSECIDTGWISSEGPFVKKFEENFSRRMNRKHGIAVSNGSAALEAACAAVGLKEGDEVILPAFTIISCAAAIVRSGAVPVLVDSDPITWNMDAGKIEEKITGKTRAIMAVHIYGLPVDMKPVLEIADRYGLKIIEDAAEAHGQTYFGKPCGSFGIISCFSFYPNKLVTTGEGGMILTDDDEIAHKCRSLRNLCFQPQRRFVHEELGWNFRMTNIQAALGLAQLERFDEFVVRKRKMGELYTRLLKECLNIQLPLAQTKYSDNIYWVYGLVLNETAPLDAAAAGKILAAKGIETRPFFWPMHEQPVFNKTGLFRGEKHPVAEMLSRRGFYIPSGLALTEEQLVEVAETVKEVIG